MTAYASAANGSWQTSTTWTPNGTPGNGDTVAIAGHAITVDADTIIGNSPSNDTTLVLEINPAGSLTIKAGKSFTLRGNASLANLSTLQIGEASGGATFEIDASNASVTTTNYRVTSGEYSFDVNNPIKTRGTATSRTIVRSNSGGGNGCFSRNPTESGNGLFDLQKTDFLRIGTASLPAFTSDGYSGGATSSIDDCLFDTCGCFNVGGADTIYADYGFSIANSTWKNTQSTECLNMRNVQAPPTNTRSITGCVFDKGIQLATYSLTFEDNWLDSFTNPFSNGFFASFTRNFIRHDFGTDRILERLGNWSECVVLNDGCTLSPTTGVYTATADSDNPHWTHTNSGASTVSDCIFEDCGSTDDGDLDLTNSTDSACVSTWQRVIATSQDKDNAGCFTIRGNGYRVDAFHCTIQTSQVGAFAVGEFGACGTNSLRGQSNIFYRNSNSGAVFEVGRYGSPGTDVITSDNFDYNCGYNLNTTGGLGTNGVDLTLTWTPNAHAVNVNPQFVDATRNFATWVASLDPTWSGNATPTRRDYNARGEHKLRLKNEPNHADYDARYTLAAFKAYKRAGFAPTNASLRNAGHDSVTIGAVAFVDSTPAATVLYSRTVWS